MSTEKLNWNQLTLWEKIDAMGVLLLKVADNIPGGKVNELQRWMEYYKRENRKLKQEIDDLKKDLTKERKRSTFYLNTSDRYRKDLENMMSKKVI